MSRILFLFLILFWGNQLDVLAQSINPDPDFASGGYFIHSVLPTINHVRGLVLQDDGKIVAAGQHLPPASDGDASVIRLTSSGSLDPTFGSGGQVVIDFDNNGDFASAVAVQTDGKIVALCKAVVAGSSDFAFARFNANGTLDNTFGTGGKVTVNPGANEYPEDLAIQADGKIVAVGTSYNASESYGQVKVIRLTSSGQLDASFGNNGIFTSQPEFFSEIKSANRVKILSDGKILVCGRYMQATSEIMSLIMIKLKINGTPDSTFGSIGEVVRDLGFADEEPTGFVIQPDGKILISGRVDGGSFGSQTLLVRLLANGSFDTGFGTGGKFVSDFGFQSPSLFHDVLHLPSGKILALGNTRVGDTHSNFFAQFNANGTLDAGFGMGGIKIIPIGTLQLFSRRMLLQPDNKVVVGGQSNEVNWQGGDARYFVGRYVFGPNVSVLSKFETKNWVVENPVSESIRIINFSENNLMKYEIINGLGQMVKTGEVSQDGQIKLDANICPGYYFLRLSSSRQTECHRLVVR